MDGWIVRDMKDNMTYWYGGGLLMNCIIEEIE